MEDLDNFLKISTSKINIFLDNLLISNIKSIDVTENVYLDSKIDEWASKLPSLKGGSKLLKSIIRTPLNDNNILSQRQKININIPDESIDILKKYEEDVLWIYTLNDEIDQDLSVNLLFLSTYFINYLNYYRPFLDLLHLYKILIVPCMSLLYPLSLFYTPYYYLNYSLKLNLSITNYVKMIFNIFKVLFKSSGNIRKDIIKLISIFIYVFIYIYAIYQSFELANVIYKTRNKLLKKIEGLSKFINEAISIININEDNWKSYLLYDIKDFNRVHNNLTNFQPTINNVYKIWKSKEIKDDISILLKIIYTIDISNSITNLKKSGNWCIANYTDETKIWGIKNPLLLNSVSNPVSLNKNLIITGPNAAGKTTYVKSITANIILAQTIGIVNAIKANILIYDAINTFMRITDILGSKSYFEAETEYCSEMIKKASDYSINNKKALFIIDEPLHSTPPLEGMSTAYAVAEYIGNLQGIRIIITTHFHKLIELEQTNKDKFINLSTSAYLDKNNKYAFTYKINRGYSKQCIAIELLEKQKFPQIVINSAIEMKEKLCNEFYK